jgi:hypothetical protein
MDPARHSTYLFARRKVSNSGFADVPTYTQPSQSIFLLPPHSSMPRGHRTCSSTWQSCPELQAPEALQDRGAETLALATSQST